MEINFASLNFTPRQPGIVVTLINMHGDADAFTTHPAQFPLTTEGRQRAALLLTVLDELNDAVCRNKAKSLEDFCTKIAPKVGAAHAVLVELLDPLVRSDCRFDDFAAEPVAYCVEVIDEDSRVSRADFGGKGYRLLSCHLAPVYLEPWA